MSLYSLFSTDVWIGLTDSTTEGTFIWIKSGDTPIYIPLGYIYYPYTDSRDCVFMHYTHWDAGYCYNARPFVCELPLVRPTLLQQTTTFICRADDHVTFVYENS